MKNPLLKTISELSPDAAYWMGEKNKYEHKIAMVLQKTIVADLPKVQFELKSLHWWLDLANDNFIKEMGWM